MPIPAKDEGVHANNAKRDLLGEDCVYRHVVWSHDAHTDFIMHNSLKGVKRLSLCITIKTLF